MKKETNEIIEKLTANKDIKIADFNFIGITSVLPENYKEYLNHYNGLNGVVGVNSYLQLWPFEDIEELNKDYAVDEFLSNIILIGSDGGDTAYGINRNGKFIEVPFIGMDDDEVNEIASDFDGFIKYLFNK